MLLNFVFDVNLHHNPIRVLVKKGFDVKRDGFIASRGQYFELMGAYVFLKQPAKL
jgi:hypothetical protein